MGNIVLTLLAIYLGLSILFTLGWSAFWIWAVIKNKRELKKITEETNL